MAYTPDVLERTERALPHARSADWLLRIPLAIVMLQQGFSKVPLSPDMADRYGVPFLMWGLAAFGEIVVGLALVVGGFLRGAVGELVTRLAGLGVALIVAGVLYVAYWAPPVDILLYNQFHVLLLAAGLYLALTARNTERAETR